MAAPMVFLDSYRITDTGDLAVRWCANPDGHADVDCGWDRGPTAYPREWTTDEAFETDSEQEERVVQLVIAEATEMRRARAGAPAFGRQDVDLTARLEAQGG